MSFDLKILNRDLVIKNGDLQTVIDSEKLIQDILKICLTNVGSNPIHPGYGSFISRTLVGSAVDTSVLVQIGKAQLNACLENLKALQQMQIKELQALSADEQLSSILGISVLRNQIDARQINVEIRVLSKGFKPITTKFTVSTIQ